MSQNLKLCWILSALIARPYALYSYVWPQLYSFSHCSALLLLTQATLAWKTAGAAGHKVKDRCGNDAQKIYVAFEAYNLQYIKQPFIDSSLAQKKPIAPYKGYLKYLSFIGVYIYLHN